MASLAIAEITDDEAASAGVRLGDTDNWGEKIRPLLVAKGFPAKALYLGNVNVRTFRDNARGITTFELLGRADG